MEIKCSKCRRLWTPDSDHKTCDQCRERGRNYKEDCSRDPKKRANELRRDATKGKRNYAWDLPMDYAESLVVQPCHYCGYLELDIHCNGIDRVDNDIGYLVSNCVPCCTICNMSKHKQSYDTFINMCHRVSNKHSQTVLPLFLAIVILVSSPTQ
jgi:hypothetical protein